MAIKLWAALAACVLVAAACTDSPHGPVSAGGGAAAGNAQSGGIGDVGSGGTAASNAGSATYPSGGSATPEIGGAGAGDAGMAATGATGNAEVPATVASDYASYSSVIFYKLVSRSSGRALS